MAIDLRTPYKGNLPFIETDTQLTVGNKTLDADEVRCMVWRLAERHGVIVVQDETTGYIASFVDAVRKGTLVPASRALVAALKHGMALVGIKQIAKGDLSKMPRRDGAAPAARALSQVVEGNEPAAPERDHLVGELRGAADEAETFGVVRASLVTFERVVAYNELGLLPGLKDKMATTVESYRPRLATDPILTHDLDPTLEYLDGASERAADSRKRNEAWREETEDHLKEEITAQAREEGRREATEAMGDRLETAFKGMKPGTADKK